ncbi:MAG: phosphodiester glycosidase family protein [Clostridiales bacterium]|jgi:hypothetical protein|nr:phosphodiester glycosidase family protein [Clostridiales bacterium]
MKRRYIWTVFLFSFLFSLLPAHHARAATPLYEYRQQKILSNGVRYELNRQMTDAGMLDVHVLTVSLGGNPYIDVEPVDSRKELGLKEPASALLSAAGAIAGTNGDFFGMSGTHSAPFGPMTVDGNLKSASAGNTDANGQEFATFILDNDNNPLMSYFKTEMHFYNNMAENIQVGTYNKVGLELNWPVIIDRKYLSSTNDLDARFSDLTKVVVAGNEITYISSPGEIVEIPEDGFVLIIPAALTDTYRPRLAVGNFAQLMMTNNLGIDFGTIKASIGGGGLILSNGQTVHDQGVVIANRQPRTAIGVSADKRNLILMAVDGRSHSIGATHEEMAELLLKYGASDAMHLDGGGSTTMVLQDPDSGGYSVANTVSDGAERRIINALGVFDRSPVGEMRELAIYLPQENTFVGAPVGVAVYGLDEFKHRVELPPGGSWSMRAQNINGGESGMWDGGAYIPTMQGTHFIEAEYGAYQKSRILNAHQIAELRCGKPSVTTLEGLATDLSFTGISTDGTEIPADNAVKVSVVPPQLGTFTGGQFIAASAGSGYLACEVNGVFTYVPLSVGGYGLEVNVFSGGVPVSFEGYPAENVTGEAAPEQAGGRPVTRLNYSFKNSAATQAAYLNFAAPVPLPGAPVALRMRVMGDGSGNWLRGRVTDAEGTQFPIDFEQSVDFTGWQTVTAMLPPEAKHPLMIDRVYMVALTTDDTTARVMYFDYLEALYPPAQTAETPVGQKYTDPLRIYSPTPGSIDQTVYGVDGTAFPTIEVPVPAVNAYSVQKHGNVTVINMAAGGGGIYAADKYQWARFTEDIKNTVPDFVVIILDEDPDNFTRPKEAELLHLSLTEQIKMLNRKVFVVSASAGSAGSTVQVRDGVRYINLTRPAEGAAAVRFYVNGREIWYDIGR